MQELSREDKRTMARVAEQAERYHEMVEYMTSIAEKHLDSNLTVEERNLLSVAYKNVVGTRRASWRVLTAMENRENETGGSLRGWGV